jgi:Transposase
VLLRESYRDGKKVKKRTIANLTKCSPQEIAAIELALRHKANLSELTGQGDHRITEGLSVGGVFVVYQMAKRLGIVDALGNGREGQLALWQVIARVLEQGSRLSSVRLAETYAIASVIGLNKGFNEENLYKNLFWLYQNQSLIEDKIFKRRSSTSTPSLFLYDVTSSYLEGDKNELAAWGYNRDKKKGKKQIVVGLLCDENGFPVTTEVFKGNTQDTSTFASQVQKIKERFGCENVVFVGDRGMIRSGQVEDLQRYGFHYITAIGKAEIQTMIKAGTIQLSLFDDSLLEVQDEGVRYVLRKNPVRVQEMAHSRASKQSSVEVLVAEQNIYLNEHPKAQISTALAKVNSKIEKLLLQKWLSVTSNDRALSLQVDEEARIKEAELDGCYVIKTDLTPTRADLSTIHDRYKDLALVERAFRTEKGEIDIRPIHVRTEESTRGHILVVMLAYMIMRELDRAWQHLYLTVSEGLRSLSTLTILQVSWGEGKEYQQIPEAREQNKRMLEALGIKLPKILPTSVARVVTRKPRRKSAVKN